MPDQHLYSELYFARFVILAEGASERMVLPRRAEARGVPLDSSFVPIVPLGGRYVSHFWRLLADLDIPHATLLDSDLGRAHGRANLIRTAFETLEEVDRDLTANPLVIDGMVRLDELDDLTDDDVLADWEDNDWLLLHTRMLLCSFSSPH